MKTTNGTSKIPCPHCGRVEPCTYAFAGIIEEESYVDVKCPNCSRWYILWQLPDGTYQADADDDPVYCPPDR